MPKNEFGYMFFISTLIASAILNALIFGDIAGLVLALNLEETTIQEINDSNNGVMKDMHLTDDLSEAIREFF
jgi:hypothetical protein